MSYILFILLDKKSHRIGFSSQAFLASLDAGEIMIIISGIGEEKLIDLQLEHICGHKSIKELDEEQSPATLVM